MCNKIRIGFKNNKRLKRFVKTCAHKFEKCHLSGFNDSLPYIPILYKQTENNVQQIPGYNSYKLFYLIYYPHCQSYLFYSDIIPGARDFKNAMKLVW